MKKYDRNSKSGLSMAENPFSEACRRMHCVANACHNFLAVTRPQPLQLIHIGQGCMRSTRLAVLRPVTHELTAQSVLQLVVLPATFGDLHHEGCLRPHWHLMVYSWLGRQLTAQLIDHLSATIELRDCSVFIVSERGCEKTFTTLSNR